MLLPTCEAGSQMLLEHLILHYPALPNGLGQIPQECALLLASDVEIILNAF